MLRKSFVFSLDVFLFFLILFFLTVFLQFENHSNFRKKIIFLSEADFVDDILSSFEAADKFYVFVDPLKAEEFIETLREAEEFSGRKFCLFLDSISLYRQNCKPTYCSKKYFAQVSKLGTITFRKVLLCLSESEEK